MSLNENCMPGLIKLEVLKMMELATTIKFHSRKKLYIYIFSFQISSRRHIILNWLIDKDSFLSFIACSLDRESTEEMDFAGLHLPKKMLITIPVYSIHTNPQSWPDPMKFDPER